MSVIRLTLKVSAPSVPVTFSRSSCASPAVDDVAAVADAVIGGVVVVAAIEDVVAGAGAEHVVARAAVEGDGVLDAVLVEHAAADVSVRAVVAATATSPRSRHPPAP